MYTCVQMELKIGQISLRLVISTKRYIYIYMWQSQIEIECYSVVYFEQITKFDVL